MKEEKAYDIKQALQVLIRNHGIFEEAKLCPYCKDRIKLIEEFAWS